jgi:membrane protein YdbS with pleckstrin-like domain
MRIISTILIVAIIATLLIKFAESIFGVVQVFGVAVAVILFYGVIVIPILQYRNHLEIKKIKEYREQHRF